MDKHYEFPFSRRALARSKALKMRYPKTDAERQAELQNICEQLVSQE